MSLEKEIRFTLNGDPVAVRVPVTLDALGLIRERLKLTGTKRGCEEGECGACKSLVDGVSKDACLLFAVELDGREVITIEGLRTSEGLSPLQKRFVETWATQCGFCTPGMVMQGTYLLAHDPDLSVEDVKRGLEGNLCRCTGYKKIVDAVVAALDEARTRG